MQVSASIKIPNFSNCDMISNHILAIQSRVFIMRKFITAFFLISFLAGCNSGEATGESTKAVSVQSKSDLNIASKMPETAKIGDRTLLSKLRVERDEMREVSFYEHPKQKQNAKTKVKLYISEVKGKLGLRFVIEYWSDSWLFVEKAWTKLDGVAYDLPTENRWTRDHGSSFIWETSDKHLDKSTMPIIKKLVYSESPTIRFEGNKYYKDFKPTKEQLGMMKDIILAYESATGEEIK